MSVIANASPSAKATVVLVVGARLSGQVSWSTEASRTASARFARVECNFHHGNNWNLPVLR